MWNELRRKQGVFIVLFIVWFLILSPSVKANENAWEPHSHESLEWDRRLAGDVSAQKEAVYDSREGSVLLPVDIWLDSTPNFGGMYTSLASNPKSIYMDKLKNKWSEGGFHYFRQDNGTPSWYVTTLRTLVDIANDTAGFGRIRLLRYGDEVLPSHFLTDPDHRLLSVDASEAEKSAVRRDMMTYTFDPSSDLWVEMVGKTRVEMADSFYNATSPKNYRLFDINKPQHLEVPDKRAQMAEAQEVWRTRLADQATKGMYTLSSLSPDEHYSYASPLVYALDNLNWSNLNILTLDTLGYLNPIGSKLTPEGKQVSVGYIEELLSRNEVFTAKGLAAGIIACRADYIGFITRINNEPLAEGLLWGRVNQKYKDNNKLEFKYDAPAPRTFLILIIGPREVVNPFISALTAKFDADPQFSGERGLDPKGDSFKGTLPFYYGGAGRSVSTFPFQYETCVIQSKNFRNYSQADQDVNVVCETGTCQPGNENETLLLTLTYDPLQCAMEEKDEIVISLRAEEDFYNFNNTKKTYTVQLTKQLALLSEVPNKQKILNELRDKGMQYVLRRSVAYVYGQDERAFAKTFEGGQMSVKPSGAGGTELTLPLTVNRKTLQPGYYRINLNVEIMSGASSDSLEAWMRQVDWTPTPPMKAGEPWDWGSGDASMNYSPDSLQTRRWVELAAYARDFGDKAKDLGDLEHAWFSKGKPNNNSPSLDYNIPPVFQVFHLNDIAEQFQRAADTQKLTLIDYTFDIHVVFAGEEEP